MTEKRATITRAKDYLLRRPTLPALLMVVALAAAACGTEADAYGQPRGVGGASAGDTGRRCERPSSVCGAPGGGASDGGPRSSAGAGRRG